MCTLKNNAWGVEHRAVSVHVCMCLYTPTNNALCFEESVVCVVGGVCTHTQTMSCVLRKVHLVCTVYMFVHRHKQCLKL